MAPSTSSLVFSGELGCREDSVRRTRGQRESSGRSVADIYLFSLLSNDAQMQGPLWRDFANVTEVPNQ